MIYIGSDWHNNHFNIIEYSKRPFASVEEMHQSCIAECQAKLKKGDKLIYLGDLSFDKRPEHIDAFLQQCIPAGVKFFYLRGNHDYQIDKVRKLADAHRKYEITLIKEIFELQHNDHFCVFSHYPLLKWNKDRYGSYMFHGHTHGQINDLNIGVKRLDVGYDNIKSWLITLDDAIKLVDNV